jgi:hypothetical protein
VLGSVTSGSVGWVRVTLIRLRLVTLHALECPELNWVCPSVSTGGVTGICPRGGLAACGLHGSVVGIKPLLREPAGR